MPASDKIFNSEQLENRRVRRQSLAKALIDAREAAGMNQSELARAAGLSRSAVIRLETGEAGLSTDRMWDLCRALGVKPSKIWAAAEADADAAKTLENPHAD